jgi:hypothetical protein
MLQQQALSRSAACLRPFDGPQRPALQEFWQQAGTEAPELWDESLAELDDAPLAPAQSNLQQISPMSIAAASGAALWL